MPFGFQILDHHWFLARTHVHDSVDEMRLDRMVPYDSRSSTLTAPYCYGLVTGSILAGQRRGHTSSSVLLRRWWQTSAAICPR
jgi:hypothetical protein